MDLSYIVEEQQPITPQTNPFFANNKNNPIDPDSTIVEGTNKSTKQMDQEEQQEQVEQSYLSYLPSVGGIMKKGASFFRKHF